MSNSELFSRMDPYFFQPLLPGFHDHLTIPLAFFEKNIKGKSEKKSAELRSDVSYKTWKVNMDGRSLTDGWKEFVVDHDLRVGDFVFFRHQGDMVFHVTGFGPSCCNLQYASSLRSDHCDCTEDNIGDLPRKKKLKKDQRAEVESSRDDTCFVANVTKFNLHDNRLYLPISFSRSNGLTNKSCEIILMDDCGRSWTSNIRHVKCSGKVYIRPGWKSFCHVNGLQAGDSCTLKLGQNRTKHVLQLSMIQSSSSKKECSEANEEKSSSTEATVEKSHSEKQSIECSNRSENNTRLKRRGSSSLRPNLFVTLTLTRTVLKYGFIRLPESFTRDGGIRNSGMMTLLDKNGGEWQTNYWKEKKSGRMHLGRGFRGFFQANGVEEGESFTLELICRDSTPTLKFCSKIHCDIESSKHQPEEAQRQKMAAEKSFTLKDIPTRKRVRIGGPVLDPSPKNRSKHQETEDNSRCTQSLSASEQVIKAKHTIPDTLTTSQQLPNVFIKDEQDLGASLHEFDSLGNISRKNGVNKKTKQEAESSEGHSSFLAHVTASNLREDRLHLPINFTRSNGLNERCCEILLMNDQGRMWKSTLKVQNAYDRAYLRGGWRSFCHENGQEVDSVFMLKLVRERTNLVLWMSSTESNSNINRNSILKMCSKSREEKIVAIKPRIEEQSWKRKEKTPTMQSASSSSCQSRFLKLSPSPMSFKRTRLRLPIPFTRENGIKKPGDIILVDKDGVNWPTKLLRDDTRGQMSLGKGWKDFWEANDLKTNNLVLEFTCDNTTPMLKFCSKIM